MTERPNLVILGSNRYIVRTQAGYRKAWKRFLKEWFEPDEYYIDARESKSYGPYPAVVSFSHYYNGGAYAVNHSWVPLNIYRERLIRELKVIDESDLAITQTQSESNESS